MPKDSRIKAIVAVNCYALFVTAMGVCFKFASEEGVGVIHFQISRTIFMSLFLVPLILTVKKHPYNDVPQGQMKIVVLRTIFEMACLVTYVWALTLIPMALGIVLLNLSPFWTSLLGYFMNNE